MAQSLSKIYVHIIFHTKMGKPLILNRIEKELYSYMAAIVKDNDSTPIKIGGTENHVHVLCCLSKSVSLAKLVEEIKKHSSRWIKAKGKEFHQFSWQKGYAGYSVSQSVLNRVIRYIDNQKEHHKRMSFKEEYILFLKEYGIDYNEEYLWTE